MELEKQVVSLELSKKLKELGVKQESLFYWIKPYDSIEPPILNHTMMRNPDIRGDLYEVNVPDNSHTFSAFTVAELGNLMEGCNQLYTNYVDDEGDWVCVYKKWDGPGFEKRKLGKFIMTTNANTEADARAKMLIYLLEQKLINL